MKETPQGTLMSYLAEKIDVKKVPKPNIYEDDKLMSIANRLGHEIYLRILLLTAAGGYVSETFNIILHNTYKDERFQTAVFVYILLFTAISLLTKQIKNEEKHWYGIYVKERRILEKWNSISELLKDKVSTPFELLAYLGVIFDDEGLITNTVVNKILEVQMKFYEKFGVIPSMIEGLEEKMGEKFEEVIKKINPFDGEKEEAKQ